VELEALCGGIQDKVPGNATEIGRHHHGTVLEPAGYSPRPGYQGTHQNDEGEGHWWQMPQGGIDEGEEPRAAALRHRPLAPKQ
jgi:hypothetical protein